MKQEKVSLTDIQYRNILQNLAKPEEHLTSEDLEAYVSQRIADSDELDAIEAHLFECEDCLEGYNRLFAAHSPLKPGVEALWSRLLKDKYREKEDVIRIRLQTALAYLKDSQRDLANRADAWLARLSEAPPAEFTLRADLNGAGSGELADAHFGHSSLAIALDVAPNRGTPERRTASVLQVATDRMTGWVEVGADGDIDFELDFWELSRPPLILVLPENGLLEQARLIELDQDSDRWIGTMPDIPPGRYLLILAPAEKEV